MSDYQTAREIIYSCGERVYNLESSIRAVCEERDELQRRLDAVLAKLEDPYWVGLPYEPTIGAIMQIAAQCREIAEGRKP